MGSEESKAWVRSKRKRNTIAKVLEDRRYRQRKIDKKYKILKAKLEEVELDDLRGD